MTLLDWIKAWFQTPSGTNKLDTFYANDTQILVVINMALEYIGKINGVVYPEVDATTLEADFSLKEKQGIIYFIEYDMCLKSKSSAGGSSLTNADKITIKDMSHTVIKETSSGSGTSSATTSMACDDWLGKINDLFFTADGGVLFATALVE